MNDSYPTPAAGKRIQAEPGVANHAWRRGADMLVLDVTGLIVASLPLGVTDRFSFTGFPPIT